MFKKPQDPRCTQRCNNELFND